jgi:sugar/nucleoside kinase (ribokinase family)
MADLVCLTNALTDIIVSVGYNDLKKINVEKGKGRGLKHIDPLVFKQILDGKKLTYCSAGSPANTAFNAKKLGLDTALIGSVGDDYAGNLYLEELRNKGISVCFRKEGDGTGTCHVLITPDKERTNITDCGLSYNFPDISEMSGLNPKIFHTSGYEIATNAEKGKEIIDYFKSKGAKLSFDLASDSIIRKAKKPIEEIVEKTDILFATEEEAMELTQLPTPFKALNELAKICQIAVLKRGKKGSVVRSKSKQYLIDIYPAKVKSTCGAGDAYASGFLFGQIQGFSPEECGRFGSYIASRVCANEMSHL